MGQVVWWVSHWSMQAWWNSCLQAGSLLSISSISYSPRHTLQVSPLQVQACQVLHPLPLPPICCMKTWCCMHTVSRHRRPQRHIRGPLWLLSRFNVQTSGSIGSSAHPWALPVSTSGAAGTVYGNNGKLLMTAVSIPSCCGSAVAI